MEVWTAYVVDKPPMDVLTPGELTGFWRAMRACSKDQGHRNRIEGPQGPALGIAEGLSQLGMTLEAPDKLRTMEGTQLCLRSGSPAMLANYLIAAYDRRVDREIQLT